MKTRRRELEWSLKSSRTSWITDSSSWSARTSITWWTNLVLRKCPTMLLKDQAWSFTLGPITLLSLTLRMSRKQLRISTRWNKKALKWLIDLVINVTTAELLKVLQSLTRDALSVSNVYIAVLTARDSTGKLDTTNSVKYWLLKPQRKPRNEIYF